MRESYCLPRVRCHHRSCLAPLRAAHDFSAPMRKLLIFVAVLLAVHVALLFVHPSGAAAPPKGDTINVGIVFDLGGRGDKSFNDGAYLGAERAEKELGVHVRFIEPGEGSDRESGLRLLAAEGMDLVVGIGFIFTDDLTQLAKEYPKTEIGRASCR